MKRDWLAMAEESLRSAKFLLELELFRSCCSRAYYAIYQAAQELLICAGLEPPERGNWSHDKTIRSLDDGVPKSILKQMRIPVLYIRQGMERLRSVREFADYNPVATFNRSHARDAVRFARMVVRIAREVSK